MFPLITFSVRGWLTTNFNLSLQNKFNNTDSNRLIPTIQTNLHRGETWVLIPKDRKYKAGFR